jgi:hypothetical protein
MHNKANRIKQLLFLCLLSALYACKAEKGKEKALAIPFFQTQTPEQTNDFAAITFDKTEHFFGKTQVGSLIKCVFKFKNTSNVPLIISEVVPQCGCTTTSFPKQPIASQQTGEIVLELDTKDKKGMIEKNARVVANIEGSYLFLFMKGEVISDEVIGVPSGTPR